MVQECFENVSKDGSFFVIKGLEPGDYRLVLDNAREIVITVLEGKRWAEDPHMIEHEDQLIFLKGEVRYLDISDIKETEDKIEIKVTSNDFDNVTAHVYGHLFVPVHMEYMNRQASQLVPK